ncbi:hypothetical protein HOLleu_30851 [Holothuria leucospilota]|uniref:Coiled-coil domain-containing protein 138 n=1 Tax=Holothuria leucospilota TaxID=206669 RepID=A0A9Q1BL19_HOLLE|nr:hypothetical protein HOLleu_30851 [Holothuria leucospilota]
MRKREKRMANSIREIHTANESIAALNSEERKHYNRALRELCQIIRLDSRRLEISQLLDEDVIDDEAPGLSTVSPQQKKRTRRRAHNENGYERRDISESSHLLPPFDSHSGDLFPTGMSSPLQNSRHQRQNQHADSRGHHTEARMPDNIRHVYEELASISEKLKREHAALLNHEVIVDEKLQLLQSEEDKRKRVLDESIKQVEAEYHHKLAELEKKQNLKLKEIQEIVAEKTKENKRMKESFDTLKNVNDSLRKQLDEICTQNKRLETQAISVQHRLTNLQRKQEISDRQRVADNFTEQLKAQAYGSKVQKTSKASKGQGPKLDPAVFDTLGILLDWISDVHLKKSQPESDADSIDVTKERCIKILPSLVDILHNLSPSNLKLQLPCLQFILWSLMVSKLQTVSLVSTLRRLGEELYRSPTVLRVKSNQEMEEKQKLALFLRSPNLHIRFLSSLIILRTLSQVDYLANVFDILRADLKDERSKEFYLEYKATLIILPFIKSSNSTLVAGAVDVFLQMSMESVYLVQFLESCCNEEWFQTCMVLLKATNLDVKLLEKMSILLQKLSKMKQSKRLFEMTGLSQQIQEMSRVGTFQDNAFLSLNLKSILFNLQLSKTVGS